MDLLTSSFHSDLESPRNTDTDPPADTIEENLDCTHKFTFPEDLIDFQCTLAGREACSTEGRDCLGILQNFGDNIIKPKIKLEPLEEVSFVQMDIGGRESLGLLVNHSFLEDGRDSLRKSCLDVLPASVSHNLLNVGFMKLSTTSSVSSVGSTFRPSLWSLDSDTELSKIFSINSKENTNSLNIAFIDSNKTDNNSETKEEKLEDNQQKNVETKDDNLAVEILDQINDSVFLESIIIAREIESGSILNDSPDDLNSTQPPEFFYDSSDECEQSPINNKKAILKTVDKYFPIGKLEECTIKIEETLSNDIKSLEKNTTSQEIVSDIEKIQNNRDANVVFDILRCEIQTENNALAVPSTEKLNTSTSPKFSNSRSRTSSNSRSRDAKDLLHNLSTIISTENIENQCEVKKILQDLANVLLVPNNSKEINDDSGHSSIEESDIESPLNFRSNIPNMKTDDRPAKRLSQSLCAEDSSKNVEIDCGEERIAQSAEKGLKARQRSLDELDSLKKTNVQKLSLPSVKFIPKKNQILKKGPMKAVIPVANMKRRSITQLKKFDSPGKHSFEASSYLKKHTSTPKMWNNIPVAQSTPEQANLTGSSSKSLNYSGAKISSPASSKLSKSSLNNSSRKDILNRSSSASAPNISRSESPSRIPSIGTLIASPSNSSHLIRRRRSVSEIKYTSSQNVPKPNINTSVGKVPKSPLTRFSNGTKLTNEAENMHVLKRERISPVSNTGDTCGLKPGNSSAGSKSAGIMRGYLSERNKNLMQYIKPLNLLDKIKK